MMAFLALGSREVLSVALQTTPGMAPFLRTLPSEG